MLARVAGMELRPWSVGAGPGREPGTCRRRAGAGRALADSLPPSAPREPMGHRSGILIALPP